jgi:hypothetical protein
LEPRRAKPSTPSSPTRLPRPRHATRAGTLAQNRHRRAHLPRRRSLTPPSIPTSTAVADLRGSTRASRRFSRAPPRPLSPSVSPPPRAPASTAARCGRRCCSGDGCVRYRITAAVRQGRMLVDGDAVPSRVPDGAAGPAVLVVAGSPTSPSLYS